MQVELNIKSNEKFGKGDLLIHNGKSFEKINKDELLKETNERIDKLNAEIECLKQFLKSYQREMTKLLKGVVSKNG